MGRCIKEQKKILIAVVEPRDGIVERDLIPFHWCYQTTLRVPVFDLCSEALGDYSTVGLCE